MIEAYDRASVLAAARAHQPELILLDDRLSGPSSDLASAVAALRAAGRAVRNTPILAYTQAAACVDEVASDGLDGRIAKPAPAAALVAAVAVWRPGDELAGAHRLIATFGEGAIAPLVARFQEQLTDALAALGTTLSADALHRIAGVAGTLGFASVGASWQRLSEGDIAIAPVARREARRVLARLDRDPRFAASG